MSWGPPPLTTDRLYLACPDDADHPGYALDGRTAAEQELPGLPSNWKIFLKEGDRPIGTIGFIRWERKARLGEIGFILMHHFTGRGFMTEACTAVLAFGFGGMGLDAIEGKSLPQNAASIRVLEKVGMRKTGCIQGRLWSKGPLINLDRFVIEKKVDSLTANGAPGKGLDH
ncbi:MAG: GNAT family N-acetyltransferase [Nitrospiria bacterium]